MTLRKIIDGTTRRTFSIVRNLLVILAEFLIALFFSNSLVKWKQENVSLSALSDYQHLYRSRADSRAEAGGG